MLSYSQMHSAVTVSSTFSVEKAIQASFWHTNFIHELVPITLSYLDLYPYGALLVTSYCALHRKDAFVCGFCVSRKGGTGGGGWGHRRVLCTWQLLRLGCKRAIVGTGWVNSQTGCMNRLIKCYPYQLGGSFLSGKASLALSRCLPSEDADYCMLINEWAWLRS